MLCISYNHTNCVYFGGGDDMHKKKGLNSLPFSFSYLHIFIFAFVLHYITIAEGKCYPTILQKNLLRQLWLDFLGIV